ncbi:TadE/TadG family type IV pilus assembly protein [Caballeronia sp. KNU42]
MLPGLCRFLKNTRGIAALEFVFVLPLMTALLFGIYEVGEFVRVNMQLANAASSMADLISQQSSGVTSGTTGVLGNFCKAGKLMMTPFPTGATTGNGAFSVAMASVTNYTIGGVTVDWESDVSCASTATALGNAATTLATAPTNLLPNAGAPGDSVIIVQATYQYSSVIQYLIPTSFTLTKTAFARPRNNLSIACTVPCS